MRVADCRSRLLSPRTLDRVRIDIPLSCTHKTRRNPSGHTRLRRYLPPRLRHSPERIGGVARPIVVGLLFIFLAYLVVFLVICASTFQSTAALGGVKPALGE